MKQWSFSQNLYPQKLVIDKDTVVAITPEQLSLTNKIFVERDFLKIEVAEQNSMIGLQDSILKIQGQQLQRWEETNKVNESIIESLKLREIENLRKNKKTNWKVGGICFCVGFSVGVLTMIFIQK
jgi:hypothetical protein